MLEKGIAGEVYNIGSGVEKKNVEVVNNILKLLGKPEKLIEFVKDRPGHDLRYSLNSDKIKNSLGWKANISFENGIEETVKWYVDNMGWVKGKIEHLEDYWDMIYK